MADAPRDETELRAIAAAVAVTSAAIADTVSGVGRQLGLDPEASAALDKLLRSAVRPDVARELVEDDLYDDLLSGRPSDRGDLFTVKEPTFSEGPLVVKIDLAKVSALVTSGFKGDIGKLAKTVTAAAKDVYMRAIVGPETLVHVVLRWLGAQDFNLVEAQVLYELCLSVDYMRSQALRLDYLFANVNQHRQGVAMAPLERPAFDGAVRVLEALQFVSLETGETEIRLAQTVIPWRRPFDRLEPA